ncbi:MAG: permease prefix domain 1-containing protein [Actinomycetota bacterium]
MAEPSLITQYLAELARQLPNGIVDELADGLDQTYRHYLGQGLGPDAAAGAAVAEFGEPQLIAAACTRASPARRDSRRLLAAGPVVGACWAAALVTSRAWTWPVPAAARMTTGVALVTVIGLLIIAATGRCYRTTGRTGAAACLGVTVIDTTLIMTVAAVAPVMTWPVILAMTLSAARIAFAVRSLRPALVSSWP